MRCFLVHQFREPYGDRAVSLLFEEGREAGGRQCEIVLRPAMRRECEMRQRSVPGLFQDAYLGRRGVDVGEILPDEFRFREPCAREPRAFRDGDYAAGFEEPPPFGEARPKPML